MSQPSVFVIKQFSTVPTIKAYLLDYNDLALNLTNATVTFSMVDSLGNITLQDQPVTILDESAGYVEYPWDVGDTDEIGVYSAEFRIEYDPTTIQRIPEDSRYPFILVHIVRGIPAAS